MLNFIKNNKLLTILIILTIIIFLSGIFIYSVIDNESKNTISNNINDIVNLYENNKINTLGNFKTTFLTNMILIFLIWILGISIIGSIFILFLYLFKVFSVGFELVSLIINLKLNNILFTILYILPSLFNLIIYFILTWYSISYSICLFKLIFLKKNINITTLTKRYIKILGVGVLFSIMSNIIEIFVLSKIIGLLF